MDLSSHIDEKTHAGAVPVSSPAARWNSAVVSAAALPCWCGGGRWSLCFCTAKFGLLRCSACGSYQTDPPPLRADEESAQFYTDYYSNSQRPNQVVQADAKRDAWFWRVAEKAPGLAEIRHSVMDIGSGDGHFCAELRAAGWPSVSGIEISRTRVARARELYPEVRFYDSALSETGIPEESLDLIVMDSVIEHLPAPAEMIVDLRRFLKPGGKIVLLTPNMDSGHFRLLGRRWTGMLAPHAHIFLFSGSALARLLVRAGFDVLACGSLHMPAYRLSQYLSRLASGDLKGTVWRAHQEIGGLYGRMIHSGPMLYVVAGRT